MQTWIVRSGNDVLFRQQVIHGPPQPAQTLRSATYATAAWLDCMEYPSDVYSVNESLISDNNPHREPDEAFSRDLENLSESFACFRSRPITARPAR